MSTAWTDSVQERRKDLGQLFPQHWLIMLSTIGDNVTELRVLFGKSLLLTLFWYIFSWEIKLESSVPTVNKYIIGTRN